MGAGAGQRPRAAAGLDDGGRTGGLLVGDRSRERGRRAEPADPVGQGTPAGRPAEQPGGRRAGQRADRHRGARARAQGAGVVRGAVRAEVDGAVRKARKTVGRAHAQVAAPRAARPGIDHVECAGEPAPVVEERGAHIGDTEDKCATPGDGPVQVDAGIGVEGRAAAARHHKVPRRNGVGRTVAVLVERAAVEGDGAAAEPADGGVVVGEADRAGVEDEAAGEVVGARQRQRSGAVLGHSSGAPHPAAERVAAGVVVEPGGPRLDLAGNGDPVDRAGVVEDHRVVRVEDAGRGPGPVRARRVPDRAGGAGPRQRRRTAGHGQPDVRRVRSRSGAAEGKGLARGRGQVVREAHPAGAAGGRAGDQLVGASAQGAFQQEELEVDRSGQAERAAVHHHDPVVGPGGRRRHVEVQGVVVQGEAAADRERSPGERRGARGKDGSGVGGNRTPDRA